MSVASVLMCHRSYLNPEMNPLLLTWRINEQLFNKFKTHQKTLNSPEYADSHIDNCV